MSVACQTQPSISMQNDGQFVKHAKRIIGLANLQNHKQ